MAGINRRGFIRSTGAAFIVGADFLRIVSADAASQKSPPSDPSVYQGNPNVTFSSVDVTTNGIQSSRMISKGVAGGAIPFFVQVSASGILAKGTNANGNPILPYEDLMFEWTGGDATNADHILHPVTGISTTTDYQQGPEATFCYRSEGDKTITLKVTYKTAIGYATAAATMLVRVAAWRGATKYLDTGAADGGDGSLGRPWNSKTPISAINAWTRGGNNRKLLVARGSNYTIPSGNSLFVGGNGFVGGRLDSYVGSYGAVAKPIFTPAGAAAPAQNAAIVFSPVNGAGINGDNVISNIKVFNGPGSTTGAGIGVINNAYGNKPWKDNYVDTCDIQSVINSGYSTAGFSGLGTPKGAPIAVDNWGFWNCNLSQPIVTNGVSHGVHGIYSEVKNWFFVVACTITGSGSDSIKHHHIYPETETHSLYRWNAFGETGLGNARRSYCINMNAGSLRPTTGTDSTIYSEYHLFADNCFGAINTPGGGSSPAYAHDLSDASNEPASTCFRNVVTERNFCASLALGTFYYYNQASHTIRHNNFYNCGGILEVAAICAGVAHTQMYKNNIYKPGDTRGNAMPNFFQEVSYNCDVMPGSPALVVAKTARNAAFVIGSAVTVSASTANGLPNGLYYVAANSFDSAGNVYGNQRWRMSLSSSPSLTPVIVVSSAGTCTITSVMAKMAPQTFTDNVIWDDRSTPALWTLHSFADWSPAGNKSLIDRNQYYTPKNGSPTPFYQGLNSTSYNFATWRRPPYLFDQNGGLSTSTTPGWKPADCALGKFS